MIDTVKLILDKDMYILKDSSRFEKDLMNPNRGFFKMVQNSTKDELKRGIYKPRLTLTNRYNVTGRSERTLSIEFSIPKLLFGNNLDEARDEDFPELFERLLRVLKEMGVLVFSPLLANAPISAVHFSKNIPLTDGTTPHYLISKIKEANIKLSLDTNQTDYQNGGHSFKLHSNSYEVAFYDKLRDIEVAKISAKRAIEIDNEIQLDLFNTFRQQAKFEVLRMEVRLDNRQKIKQLFRTVGIVSDLTLQSIFSAKISQQILLYYLNEIENKRPELLNYKPKNSQALLTDLIINNPKMSVRKIAQVFGLRRIFDDITPLEFRAMFNKQGQRNWYRLIAETKRVKFPKTKSPFEVVRQCLTRFEQFKMVDFESPVLNN